MVLGKQKLKKRSASHLGLKKHLTVKAPKKKLDQELDDLTPCFQRTNETLSKSFHEIDPPSPSDFDPKLKMSLIVDWIS